MLTHRLKTNPLTIFVFAILFSYWTYLYFHTTTEITLDAVGYENFARQVYEHGWTSYYQNGPNREPLYIGFIAYSMKLADWLHCPYLAIVRFLQIAILFITILLTNTLLLKLEVRTWLRLATIFYLCVYPAIINSTFSLFSEIISYPFILAIILLTTRVWTTIENNSSPRLVYESAALGILLIGLTLSKALFEYILILFLSPFFFLFLKSVVEKKGKIALRIFTFIFITFLLFFGTLHQLKLFNKRVNGIYSYSDRGWLLLGNTDRRTNPFDAKQTLIALSYVPGEGVCRQSFNPADCYLWSTMSSDTLSYYIRNLLLNHATRQQQLFDEKAFLEKLAYQPGNKDCRKVLDENECHMWEIMPEKTRERYRSMLASPDGGTLAHLNKRIIRYCLKRMFQHPVSYSTYYFIETPKVFFWESTQIGTVTYPTGIKHFYDNVFFKNGLRLLLALLSLFSFLYCVFIVIKNFRGIFISVPKKPSVTLIFFVVMMISSFTLLHALIQIIPRYIFSIVPLFVAIIGLSLNDRIGNQKRL